VKESAYLQIPAYMTGINGMDLLIAGIERKKWDPGDAVL
jgi:hypothetical protein